MSKCPYKIPVKTVCLTSAEIWVIKDSEEKVIFWDVTKEQADFLAEAINSHDKLLEVKRELRASDNWLHRLLKSCVIFLDDGEVTKRAIEKQSRYNQQVLKESGKE